ncbi:MAG TPA: hypothetical protein VNZ57_07445 [Longimicrobiales bacterium]|nr:hypothetical protein [Longimicrobiales bacterium]
MCRSSLSWLYAALAFAALTLASCEAGHPLEPYYDAELGQFVVHSEAPNALVQTIRLSHAEPAVGDTLVIVSTVVNRGDDAIDVTARICGLDMRTELELEDHAPRCMAYSEQRLLAPGDSIWASDGGIVASRPGRYTLRIRHLLDPQSSVEIRIRVREP